MHIKALVLDGFKSFGRPTRIPLYEDFTVITGPNGSGKSNIIDGVLFALGLAKTRGIRAEKLTDLIYNPGHDGEESTDDGPREASVEVILDNSEGTLTREQVVTAAGTDRVGDVDEITIKRRVKQTEDNYYSYYYLNERSVNLGDIQDLLAQAGIAPEGYNVVMQGDVTEIINMSAGQRRGIIDEIAGVAEFDAKKESAFEELDAVEERINEATLKIEEKEQRLDQLADERETALEYQSLREKKEEYEGYLKAAELEDKRTELAEVERDIENHEATLAERQETLDSAQGRLTRLEDELEELNREIERKGEDEQLELKREMESIKGEIDRLDGRIETADDRIEDAEDERRQAFVQIDRKQEQLEEIESTITELKVEQASVKSTIQSKEAELADIQAEIENADTEFDELKAELADAKECREELKTQANDAQRKKDRLLDDARRRSSEVEEVRSDLDAAREKCPDLKAEQSQLRSELDKAEKNKRTIEEKIETLRENREAAKAELAEIETDLREKQSEYADLEARSTDDSSWPRSVTTILNAGKQGVHGAVGELGSVDSEYATACETAAGGRLANVVVDDDSVGSECIDYLKSRNAGRATFLPITEMDDRGLPNCPAMPGVVDFARNLVEYDSTYEGIFSYVLGSTLVVEDMDTARELMGRFRMVTLDGDLVEKSGAMTGGSGGGSRYAFSASGGGKLERLAEEIDQLEDKRRQHEDEIRDLEEQIDAARDRKSDAVEKLQSIEADIERKHEAIDDAQTEIEELEGRLDEIEAEREEVESEMAEVDAEITEIEAERGDVETEIEELEAELEESQIPELTDEADTIREEIRDHEDRMDDLDSKLNEQQLEQQYTEEAIDDLHDTVEDAQDRKADAQDEIKELEGKIEDKEDKLDEKREAIEELEAELVDLKDEREELKSTVKDAQADRDEAEEAVNEIDSTLEAAREEQDRLEWEIDELQQAVGDYDPDEIPDHDEVEANIDRLEREMETLEPVNMLAIEEYEEVEADLDELVEGRDTLEAERDGITDRIDQYESQKKATFMDAFESINGHFEDIFSRLSDGSGELVLEDPDDPFEGGLTMKAQPADKPIQRLAAMSGGEKSLTALAFIFAIQRHNPAPFYALDEIDAFLDAVNAERVGEMVDDLAGEAQFVVVSHRSALLERSERAIGVTMQDDNYSAVTGIQFDGEDAADPEVPADD